MRLWYVVPPHRRSKLVNHLKIQTFKYPLAVSRKDLYRVLPLCKHWGIQARKQTHETGNTASVPREIPAKWSLLSWSSPRGACVYIEQGKWKSFAPPALFAFRLPHCIVSDCPSYKGFVKFQGKFIIGMNFCMRNLCQVIVTDSRLSACILVLFGYLPFYVQTYLQLFQGLRGQWDICQIKAKKHNTGSLLSFSSLPSLVLHISIHSPYSTLQTAGRKRWWLVTRF